MKSESAFPVLERDDEHLQCTSQGMSLRDYAEIHFIQGLLAHPYRHGSNEDFVDDAAQIAAEWLRRREERKCSTE